MPKYGIGIYIFDGDSHLYLVKKPESSFSDKGKKWLVPGESFEKQLSRSRQSEVVRKVLSQESPITKDYLENNYATCHYVGSWEHKHDDCVYIFDNYIVLLQTEHFRHLMEDNKININGIEGMAFHILGLPVDSISDLTKNYLQSLLFQNCSYLPAEINKITVDEFKKYLGNDYIRYHLINRLGQGGYGKVFAVLDIATLLPRVIKVPVPNLRDDNWSERFLLEGMTLLSLIHKKVKNIEEIFSINRGGDGRYYLVKEFIRGDTLDKCSFDNDSIGVIIGSIIKTLAQVHKEKLCHRDLKPNNIMFDYSENLKIIITLIDFGLVKHLESRKFYQKQFTKANDRFGNEFYQSYVTFKDYRQHNLLDDYYSILHIFYWLFDKKNFYNDYYNELQPSAVIQEVNAGKERCNDPFLENCAIENFRNKRGSESYFELFFKFHNTISNAYNNIYEIKEITLPNGNIDYEPSLKDGLDIDKKMGEILNEVETIFQ